MLEDLKHLAFKNYYVEAIKSLSRHGLYWFTDTRGIAHTLDDLISEAGYDVILCEVAPRWELVIYESDKYDFDTVSIIAIKRHEARENGVEESCLPSV